MERQTFGSLVRAGLLEIGDGYRAKNDELGGSGPIFLRSAYLQDSGFVLSDPERFISPALEHFGPKLSQIGDVVITTKGNSTGRVGCIRAAEAGAVYSPHLSYWRSRSAEVIDQAFLYYWAQSADFRRQLAGMAHSTDMAPYLSLRDQLRIEISLPEIGRQVRIGSVLSALDDKIELNRRMNETLEASARALFRDWFVDFGPTRAKAEGRAAYLAPDLWSIFPDSLGDDGVPDGWEQESLLDQAHWVNGAAYKNMHFVDRRDGLPVVKIAELKAGVSEQTKFTNTDLGERYRIEDGELLFSWSGNPDTSIDAFVWTGGRAWLNQHIFAVRENGKRSKAELFVLLKWLMPEFAEIARNKQTTGLGHVTKDDMKRMQVVSPSPAIRAAFRERVAPIFDQILSLTTESRTLAETRDALLPKLMSGAIRVRDAERAVAA